MFEREAHAQDRGAPRFLVQGTIYPDVVELRGPERRRAAANQDPSQRGRPAQRYAFELVEPLRFLFKDEVRAVGEALGLPEAMVWRQPFPGPGLAVRCLGDMTWERLQTLRAADTIVTDEIDGPVCCATSLSRLPCSRRCARWASWATAAPTVTSSPSAR